MNAKYTGIRCWTCCGTELPTRWYHCLPLYLAFQAGVHVGQVLGLVTRNTRKKKSLANESSWEMQILKLLCMLHGMVTLHCALSSAYMLNSTRAVWTVLTLYFFWLHRTVWFFRLEAVTEKTMWFLFVWPQFAFERLCTCLWIN